MRKKSIWTSLLGLLLSICLMGAGIVLHAVQANRHFITTFYAMSSDEVDEPIRIVELSDLHLHEYGENNAELVDRISALKPDIIAIVGDMTNKDVADYSVVIRLLERLTGIAPVYYAAGNHEYADILYNENSALIDNIEATGAIYVDNTIAEAVIRGTAFKIGGVCKNRADLLKYTVTRQMLAELSTGEGFTLLLSHYPEGFIGDTMADYPFDLVLCGHAHGGQVRIPLYGDGLYSTDQGFLPKYTSGMREMSGSTVVISRGLGDATSPIPRINNQPELVVIDIE